jgi:hypothetical protein
MKKTAIALVLCSALIEVPFAVHANAGMIATGDAVASLTRTENREKVERFMQREDVKREFGKLGVNGEEAALRVASMTDFEIQKISGAIDQNPAGADAVVISLTTVLLIVIILLLLGKI